ncbi:MAG: UDP-N-acetylmuramoyl-L-alanyl-D-glutamate--2,6-diaminopimelate ligase [Candidatus Eremiobacteraeota bacterium]|nr:UDP-N-acetylmuramoyl-L-alanyl-D-glutamate--2,6-diaminopimelate ligase [Candidatus Eremiobacteraeota bacterium]
MLPLPADATALVVDDEARALSRLAAAFYGDPSTELTVVGVTGTNGKTTVTHMVAAILERAGVPAGTIGTLGARFGTHAWSLDNTTPLADELQKTLAVMRDAGARAVAMETSSHALALQRVADVRFRIGVFTNLTRDHLDFHGSLEAYAAAKRSLFERAATAVLNADDAFARQWTDELRAARRPVITFALDAAADVRGEQVHSSARGVRCVVSGAALELPLAGRFNAANALAAIAVARALDIPDATSIAALETLPPVPGRMQRIDGAHLPIFVDYAHTPDALRNALRAARDAATGRVIVVFGCGGDRDKGKRPLMGRLATTLADVAIVTNDNPRGEDPASIAAEILSGAASEHASVRTILDRRTAIREAVALAGAGDVVLVAGKGHEPYQLIGERVLAFDDADEARRALEERVAT